MKKDIQTLQDDVNAAKEAEVDAAAAIKSAKKRLAELRALKRQKRAGATKIALQDAENHLACAKKLYTECLDSVSEKEAILSKALGDIPIPTSHHAEEEASSPKSSMAAIIGSSIDSPNSANPTDSKSLPIIVDTKRPTVFPSPPPATMNHSGNATSDEPLIPQAHSSPASQAVQDIPPTNDTAADESNALYTRAPPSSSLLDTAAHTFLPTQALTTSQADSPTGNDIDVNMHPVEGGLLINVDLKQLFNELIESAERNLTSQPGGFFQRHQSILHGYESTLAAHNADLRHHEAYFTGVAKGEGVPQHYDQWFVNKYLEITSDVMNTARTAIAKGEKLLNGYKARMDAELRSSTLVEALHICRDRMTARGSEMSDVAKWKTLLHYTEDELMKTDAEAVAAFQSGGKRQDVDDFEDGEDVKPKIEAGFADKKTPAPEKFREDWLDMSETQQEETQVACKKAINLFLMKGERIDSAMRRMIREIPELAPEAGTTSRSLSRHILERDFIICRHHGRYRTKRDFAKVDGPFQIEGVGYSKNYKGRAKTGNSQEGHIDCGCSEDLALFELFWWKTWSIRSSRPNLVTFRENLKTDTIPPRLRAFFAEAYQDISSLTLDDLFAIQWGEEGYENRLHMLQVMRKVTMLRSQGVEIPGFQLTSESSGTSQ